MRRSLHQTRLRPAWQRYLGTLLLTLVVVAVRLQLNPWWGEVHNRHLVFLPTTMLAAYFGGFGPGVFATLLSAFAIEHFWRGTPHPFFHQLSSDVGLFCLVSIALCALIESLHVARDRANVAKEAREHVMAIVAHDLRNPLSLVRMSSSAIQRARPPLDDESLKRLQSLDRAVTRMENLIRDLVDVTRIEHGALTLKVRDERIEPIVQELVDMYSVLARAKNITFQVERSGLARPFPLDRNRVMQVLGNVLGNAVKFTPYGGRITLRVRSDEKALTFEVRDTGPGIPRDHLPHVFERYWKGEDGRGTGLGLFIARAIASAHGGAIDVRSEVGFGALFSLTIPRHPAPPKAPGLFRKRWALLQEWGRHHTSAPR